MKIFSGKHKILAFAVYYCLLFDLCVKQADRVDLRPILANSPEMILACIQSCLEHL